MSTLFVIQAATALGLALILAPYIPLNLRSDFKHSLGIALALGIPSLAPFLWIARDLLNMVKPLLSMQPLVAYVDLPRIIDTYGYLPIMFSLLGTFLLVVRGGKRNYGLALGLLVLLVMLVSYFTFHYGIPIMYYRGLMWMMLVMSIVAGAGLAGVRGLRLPSRFAIRLKSARLANNAGNILCLILIGLTLAIAIPDRQQTPYYYMIDSEDYQACVSLKKNCPTGLSMISGRSEPIRRTLISM
jgi:hypothetical protein